MWISFSNAFLSIVDPNDLKVGDDKLLVRARRKGDIEHVFPSAKVTRTPGRDYLYRSYIDRDVVADTIAEHLRTITYGNFKNSVRDNKLHHAYSSVWGVMSRLQEVPPYSSTRNRRQGDLL